MMDWKEEGFEGWRAAGFNSDYVSIDAKNKTIRPAWSVEGMLARGFVPKGQTVEFLNKNGYDSELQHAASTFEKGQRLTVKACHIGQSSSSYEFEETEGKWNTVMFQKVTA